MKRFITRIILFLILIAVCDYVLGYFGDYALNHSKSGINHKAKEIRDTATPEIVILGSSRAEHHYIPHIISESLKAEAYNMGVDGNGILLMYPYLSQLLTHHTPTTVIYDVLPKFDFYDDNPELYLKNLSVLRGLPAADSIMSEIDGTISIKLRSHIYPYNSQYPSLIQGILKHEDIYTQGYVPLDGRLSIGHERTILDNAPYSQLKLQAFDNLISLCSKNNIRLIIAISPFYGKFSPVDLKNIAELCERKGLEFMNFSEHTDFISHPELFSDTYHLNSTGAELFTRIFVDSITSPDMINDVTEPLPVSDEIR